MVKRLIGVKKDMRNIVLRKKYSRREEAMKRNKVLTAWEAEKRRKENRKLLLLRKLYRIVEPQLYTVKRKNWETEYTWSCIHSSVLLNTIHWSSKGWWQDYNQQKEEDFCYQDIQFAELVPDEICQRCYTFWICNIKLMKNYRVTKLFEFLNSFNTPLLISGCEHHTDPIWSQLLAYCKSNSLVCSCDNSIPRKQFHRSS